jgi:hypothetical protein
MDNNIIENASGYSKGAVIGAVGGLILGVSLRTKPLYWAIGGFLIGGYVGHLFAEAGKDSEKIIFKPIF